MPKTKMVHLFDTLWLTGKRQNYKKIHEYFKERQRIHQLSGVRKFWLKNKTRPTPISRVRDIDNLR